MIVNHNGRTSSSTGQYIDNYRLLRLLGSGADATVYLGEHRYLKRLAAIKMRHTPLDGQEKECFLEEARLLANLSHPNIIRVHEFAVAKQVSCAGDNAFTEYIPYLVMDFAPGNTLRALYPAGSCLFTDTIVDYSNQIAAALQYAHNNGIIHRDVKPENCLLNEQQEVMLSDFGLALFAPAPDMLSTQQMVGTLPYTAPEQLRGKPGFASDQYSLGVMAYEWLCGHRPFEGEQVEIIKKHLSSPPPSLRSYNPGISPAIEEVVLKALEKNPQRRYPSVQAFAKAFEHASQWNISDFAPYSHAAARVASPDHSQIEIVLASPFSIGDFGSEDFRGTKRRPHEEETYALPVEQEQADKRNKLRRGAQKQPQSSSPDISRRGQMSVALLIGIIVFILLLGSSGMFYVLTPTPLSTLSIKAHPTIAATALPSVMAVANFAASPSGIHNMTLVKDETAFQDDHSILGRNKQVVFDFFLPGFPGSGKSK